MERKRIIQSLLAVGLWQMESPISDKRFAIQLLFIASRSSKIASRVFFMKLGEYTG